MPFEPCLKYWQILDPSEDDETEQHGINTKNIIKLSREYRTSLARLIKGMIQLLLLLTSTGSVDPEMFSSILQVGLLDMIPNVLFSQ